ncbi:MAG TPA: hypothetical protein VHB98_03640 [Chloroflexota bacterium]|jgi:hypothetical protein|nr:hypothetical protein [Chloroflexota bacterium]
MNMRKLLAGVGIAGVLAASPLVGNGSHAAGLSSQISFTMVPSTPAISACLPYARGYVLVQNLGINQAMTVYAAGLLPNTGYDLFVTNQAAAPFGPSWYQSDLETNYSGTGVAVVRGVFSHETFLLSPGQGALGSGIVFPPTHTFNLGLWFNNPQDPFNAHCEPGKTTPVVTPFNGEQHAGVQALRTQILNPANVQLGPLAGL